MPIDQSRIRALIPHAGAMCLLDRVEAYDARNIVCVARSHREPDNPLRRYDRLSAICGLEYAAQAMALHGALAAAPQGPRPGYLVAVRDLTWRVNGLDSLPGELLVQAERVQGDAAAAVYRFAIEAEGQAVVGGRATVKFGRHAG